MTTAQATVNESMDFELPEELPERSSQSVYRIVGARAAFPPSALQAKIGGTPRMNLEFVYEPLDFRYDSDKTKFEDDLEHAWFAMFDKNGDPAAKGSNLDVVKQAFSKLSFPITNKTSLDALIGKNFVMENKRITRTFKKPDPNNPGETIDEESNSYVLVPVAPAADDYTHTGPTKTFTRPRNKAVAASAAMTAENASEALPKLIKVLEGKSESEYMNAIVGSKDPDITRAPYIVEASSNPRALTNRMLEAGMRQLDGKLVL